MKLFMFAGPNGAGKSTFIDDFLKQPENAGLLYLCPDDIFKTLYRKSDDVEVYRQTYIKAMEKTKLIRESALSNHEDFDFETVFSTLEKVDFLNEAKTKGYKIISFFIATQDVNINIARVKYRASKGGHDVPEDKIISRYSKSFNQMQHLFAISDEFQVLDNSSDTYKVAYWQDSSGFSISKEFENEGWVKKYVVPHVNV